MYGVWCIVYGAWCMLYGVVYSVAKSGVTGHDVSEFESLFIFIQESFCLFIVQVT